MIDNNIEISRIDVDAELAGGGSYGHGLRHLIASDEEIMGLLGN